MSTMKNEINAAVAQCTDLPQLIEALCGVLARNASTLKGISYRYALIAADTGFSKCFALEDGRYADLPDGAAVDVTVIGKAADLMAILRRELAPASALLFGKVKVRGSKAALLRLAEFV